MLANVATQGRRNKGSTLLGGFSRYDSDGNVLMQIQKIGGTQKGGL